jgi:hypothetical protein
MAGGVASQALLAPRGGLKYTVAVANGPPWANVTVATAIRVGPAITETVVW